MSETGKIDAATLLARWRDAGLITADRAPALAAAILADARDGEPPLHLKILTAVGTAIATGFFLAFLGVARIISFDHGPSLVVSGTVFLAIGIGLAFATAGARVGIGRDLLAQTSFVAMALGKVLFVGGALTIWGERTTGVATAALFVVTVVTYPVSGSSLDRLLSPFAVAAAALFELIGAEHGGTAGLTLYHLTATAIAGALLLPHRVPTVLRPIGIAALGAMGIVVSILAAGHDLGIRATGPLDPRPIEALLALSLIGTVAWAAGGLDRLAAPPLAAAALGIVALGFAGAPGLVFALGLLVLGHARHDTPTRVAGILALPAFLALWYWGRDMTLMQKSAALIAAGLLLLGARGVMRLAGWDREATP
jgi:hypothetical protein